MVTRPILSVLTASTVAATLVYCAPPSSALACSPNLSSVTDIRPQSAGVLPANAAIVFKGFSLGTYSFHGPEGELQATINGEPAELIVDEQLSAYSDHDDSFWLLAVRLQPTPSPGDTVELSGAPCIYNPCDSLAYQVTVGPPDLTPPPSVLDTAWEFVFEGTGVLEPNADSCGDYPWTGSFDITTTFDALSANDEWSFVDVEVVPSPDKRYRKAWQAVWLLDALTEDRRIPIHWDQLPAYVDPAPYCVHVTVRDAAGNTGGTRKQCTPCRTAERVGGEMSYCPYPDGYCLGNSPASDDACVRRESLIGCSLTTGYPSISWLLVFALVAVRIRRIRDTAWNAGRKPPTQ